MPWDLIEKTGLVLGIIASLIEIVSFISNPRLSLKTIKVYLDDLPTNSFRFGFMHSLYYFALTLALLTIILLPTGLILLALRFPVGDKVLAALGYFWIGLPLLGLLMGLVSGWAWKK